MNIIIDDAKKGALRVAELERQIDVPILLQLSLPSLQYANHLIYFLSFFFLFSVGGRHENS